MRATQLGSLISIHRTTVIARFMRATHFSWWNKKLDHPHSRVMTNSIERYRQISPGWPAFAGHDTIVVGD
jgi:hypothetical protein